MNISEQKLSDADLDKLWSESIVKVTHVIRQEVPKLNISLLIANGSIWNKRDIARRSARVS